MLVYSYKTNILIQAYENLYKYTLYNNIIFQTTQHSLLYSIGIMYVYKVCTIGNEKNSADTLNLNFNAILW